MPREENHGGASSSGEPSRSCSEKGFDTDRSIFKVGYFAREYSELGGYLPPAMGIKFPDLPNGFGRFL